MVIKKVRKKGGRLELNLAQIKPKNVLTWSCSRRKKPRGRRTLLVGSARLHIALPANFAVSI